MVTIGPRPMHRFLALTGLPQRLCALQLIATCALQGCATTATDATKHPWHRVRTQHFEVLTDSDPQKASDLASDLECFHRVLEIWTNAEPREVAPPLRIFLSGGRVFHALTGARARVGGVFKAG